MSDSGLRNYLTAKGETIPETSLSSGAPKFANDIQWARMYLVNAGLLEPMKTAGYGNWKLTRDWLGTRLTRIVWAIFKRPQTRARSELRLRRRRHGRTIAGEFAGTESWKHF